MARSARIAALDGCKFAMEWDSRMLPKRLVRELLCRTDLAQFSAVASDLSELSVPLSARSRCKKREASCPNLQPLSVAGRL